tara:strand:+ start:186 stop:767 length:582 start_codon:yes stop_codon:yes gene_type:complete
VLTHVLHLGGASRYETDPLARATSRGGAAWGGGADGKRTGARNELLEHDNVKPHRYAVSRPDLVTVDFASNATRRDVHAKRRANRRAELGAVDLDTELVAHHRCSNACSDARPVEDANRHRLYLRADARAIVDADACTERDAVVGPERGALDRYANARADARTDKYTHDGGPDRCAECSTQRCADLGSKCSRR